MTVQAQAEAKLQKMVDEGKARAMRGIEALHREYQIRRDMMVKPAAVDVEWAPVETQAAAPNPGGLRLRIEGDGTDYALTPHAHGQLLSAAEVPTRFADTLTDHGLADLLRENVRRLLQKTAADGLLIREVGGTVKGILSPAYRRMDLSPLFEAFITESIRSGLVPHSGEVTDTRAFATFVRPEVATVAPVPGIQVGRLLRRVKLLEERTC